MVSSIAPYANEYNDRIIAIVNDKVILKSEVQEAIDYLPPEIVKDLQLLNDKEIIDKVLQSLIDTNLLLQAAERFGIKISDIALENKLVELANNQKLTINELRNQVVNSGQNYIKYVENIRNKMTIETLFVSQFYSRMNVTEEEVENFIEREKINQLGNMDYDLIELVIIDEDKTLDPSIANNIYQDIIIHGFKYVQKNYQSHKININNLGKINQDKLPDIFLKALNNKLDDQYTDLISSSKGYHVLKILDSVNKSSSIVNEYKVRHILLKPNVMSKDTEILEKLINI